MSKHTPKPWSFTSYAQYPSKRRGWQIYSPKTAGHIARIEIHGEYKTGLSEEVNEANTLLMTTAPDNYESNKRLVELWENTLAPLHLEKSLNPAEYGAWEIAIKTAKEAIAKAANDRVIRGHTKRIYL